MTIGLFTRVFPRDLLFTDQYICLFLCRHCTVADWKRHVKWTKEDPYMDSCRPPPNPRVLYVGSSKYADLKQRERERERERERGGERDGGRGRPHEGGDTPRPIWSRVRPLSTSSCEDDQGDVRRLHLAAWEHSRTPPGTPLSVSFCAINGSVSHTQRGHTTPRHYSVLRFPLSAWC